MSIRLRYIIALSIVALSISVSAFYLQAIFKSQENDAFIINKAGQQRMLSQRIALIIQRLAIKSSTTETTMLADSIALFTSNHELLTQLDPLPDSVSELYYGDPNLDKRVIAFIDNATTFSTQPEIGAIPVEFELNSVTALLRDLNNVVNALEVEANLRLDNSKRIETTIWIFTLFILVLEGIFIFYPMEKTITKTISRLTQERERAELAELKAMDASKVKSEFMASMSHELRTPMNGLFGMIDLAIDNPQKASSYLLKAKNSGKQLLNLINDLLDISKVESGKLELERMSFDLMQMIDEVVSVQEINCRSNGVEFHFEKSSALPMYAIGDPSRLAQTLHNLLSNAVKFTSKGSVTLTVGVKIWEKTPWLVMQVKDTGIGISEEQQNLIFDRFTQADQSTTRLYGGTGLGLSITKSLIELMGGTIDVESATGMGSTFTLNVPIEVDKSKKPVSASSQPLRCAIVDDLLTSCEYLSGVVSHIGYSSDYFESAQAFLASNEKYDIILLDYMMPDVSGLDLLKRLSDTPDYQVPPVIMISAAYDQIQIPEALKQYVWRIHKKPLNRMALEHDLLEIKRIKTDGLSTSDVALERNRILVAEDNEINAEIAKTILESEGYEVTLAGDGEKAVSACKQQAFDLILMDMNMPFMDGVTATKVIRNELNIDTPVIAFTANAYEADKKVCRDAGMNDFLSKPIDKNQILKKVASLI